MADTILQAPVLTKFAYPFLLVFFIVFAVLEKSKVLGDKKQLNALVAFVIGLIFVSAAYPKMVVGNMILFLSIALVVVFVALLLWGFVAGDKGLEFGSMPAGLKWTIGIAIFIGVVLAVLWATGVGFGFFDSIFGSGTKTFWTNALFVIMVAIALAVVLGSSSGGSS